MGEREASSFPLFPLPIVALPGEAIPLHIFEERYRRMAERCLEAEPGSLERQFGIIWLSEQELKSVGCACELEEVLERTADGRLNIIARGRRPFHLLQRKEDLPYPAGVVEFLDEQPEDPDEHAQRQAHGVYAQLVRAATDRTLRRSELRAMDSYGMAATVELAPAAKQQLLELRSENARLRLLASLLQTAIERVELSERAAARARSNGKVNLA